MKVLAFVCGLLPATALAAEPTFHRDVLPILQSRCQECHRPGEIGPMPLLTYRQARPRATGFTEDRWVQTVEVRPSNRAVVHHAVIFIREPQSKWLRDAKPGVPVAGGPRDTGGAGSEILTIYTPGMVPDAWDSGVAKLVKAGTPPRS